MTNNFYIHRETNKINKLIIKYIFSVCMLSVLQGCIVQPHSFKDVDPLNGINPYEAILIADQEIVKANFQTYFEPITPIIRKDEHAQQYPDYWFVDYTPEVSIDFTSYLIVIDKKTGEVIHARDYYWPKKQPGLDWVFESTEYRQRQKN